MHIFLYKLPFFSLIFEYKLENNSIKLPCKNHRNIPIIKLDEFLFSGE